ncbi:Oidioi.mRNA.OKI2018_I69.PAR.g10901.t2.cds [Oikopleura dioica]|uniref:Oidioi.mRNA.OKI2018_I69.PAR.g10901.t2.cds n=1 Tax=Oikopleura dioica TaxID=34765 RepID=A0ABN7RW79_OIKDI|nr:Oidioi.mRNA.OKI2018_I69.PAR.g10901.t2.cds [Oikopleura dioica]
MSDTSDTESTSSESSVKQEPREELSMEEGCSICEIADANDVDPLVYCDQCNVAVHKLCYGIQTIPSGDWYCNTCKYWRKRRSKDPLTSMKPLKCVLCFDVRGAMKEVYPKRGSDDTWAHILCALFFEEVQFRDPETSSGISHIESIPHSKKVTAEKKCEFCTREGYLRFCDCGCGKAFHPSCASRKGLCLMLDNSQIESKQTTEFFVFCSQEKCKDKKAAHSRHILETLERKRKEDVRDAAKRKQLEKIKNLPKVNSTFPGTGRPKKSSIPKRKSSDDGSLVSENGKKVKLESKPKVDDKTEANALKLLKESFDEFTNIAEKDDSLTPMKMFCNFLDRLDEEEHKCHPKLRSTLQSLWGMHCEALRLEHELEEVRKTQKFMETQIEFQKQIGFSDIPTFPYKNQIINPYLLHKRVQSHE